MTPAVGRARCTVPGAVVCAAGLVLGALFLVPSADAQMPDPRLMHGQAIPAGELAPGGVTVRVVRRMVGNNIAGVEVELHGAGDVRRATTGADGRAQFAGVPVGSRVHATASVEGERLESSPFDVPAAGGVRTILVAGLGLGSSQGSSQGSDPAVTGSDPTTVLSFGNNTRFALEFQDDTIALFYLLEIVNATGAPLSLAAPLQITLPQGASGASALEGASPLVAVSGRQVTIAGPIPTGVTPVPVAFRLESWAAREEIVQAFPLAITQVAIGVQRLAGLTIESAQAPSIRDATLGGHAFLIASGPALAAGAPLHLTLAGLPHRNPWPRYLALTLAAAIAGLGVWLARRPVSHDDSRRRTTLEGRRAKGLTALAALDAEYRAGSLAEAAYERQRASLLADLERVYAELDAGGRPPEGGRGLAA